MAKIWTNYSDNEQPFIDLTIIERAKNMSSSPHSPPYKRDDVDIPLLNHRQTAVVKFVWSLTRDERDWLSAFFMNKVRASRFFDLLETDARGNSRLKVSNYSLIMNFVNGNPDYFKRVLDEEGDFWLLVSCRVNYKSNFYECLIKRVWDLSEAEQRAVEL